MLTDYNMFRLLKRIPSLQRRLLYLICAMLLVFGVYLVTTMSQNSPLGYKQGKIPEVLRSMGGQSQPPGVHLDLHRRERPPSTRGLHLPIDVERKMPPTPAVEADELPKAEVGQDLIPDIIEQQPPKKVEHMAQNANNVPNASSRGTSSDPYNGPKNARQRAVVDAFMHAWNAYKRYAWGHDELRPVSKGWQEWFGIGLTIVDSLDTMYIMGLKDEFKLGRDWVARNLTFSRDGDVQLFEIVIRALGGLMSSYHLSGDRIFLHKALELGNRLFPCFNGPTKVPCNRINMRTGKSNFIEISTAETGTLQLEFRALARAVQDNKFEKAMEDISTHLHNLPKLDGLVACYLSGQTGMFRMSATVSMGASADSYYEYILKQWLQTGKTKQWLKEDYLQSIEGMQKHLLRYTVPSHLPFVGALSSMGSRSLRPEMEHLTCFVPGMLALGYIYGLGHFEGSRNHLEIAKALGKTCYEMYHRMPTGLSPEVAGMNIHAGSKEDIYVNFGTQHNLQRPETVESLYYLYKATGDPVYQEWGWEIFQAFEKYTKLEEGYASINNVRRADNPGYRDKMETFYLAETLKYLYLLFSDDPNLLPLDKWVINTEAHPLPIYKS